MTFSYVAVALTHFRPQQLSVCWL